MASSPTSWHRPGSDPATCDRRPPALRPVLSLRARPVRVADLPAGHGVSYGPTWRAARPSRIATLPLGYGDGWPRSLSNRAQALVRGVRVPVVGNVAMDATMIDVTDVPGPPVDADDEVVLLGRQGERRNPGGRGGAMAHHELVGGGDLDVRSPDPGVRCGGRADGLARALSPGDGLARIELWNGDICDLEVDAIVNAANLSLWMSTGVGGEIKRAGGDAIEFAAVRQAPVPLGEAIVTPAGKLAARAVIHAVSLDRDRRTSADVIDKAVRSAMARARDIRARSIAFPAMGTGVGGFPLDEAARVTVRAVRDELPRSPVIEHVIFAMRGAAAYQAFEAALAVPSPAATTPDGGAGTGRAGACMSFSYERTDEQRDELVERVAREIQLRGLTGPAVHFLEASRPYRPLGANAMLFFDPVLRGLFGGGDASASLILADDAGIELLIARLEEIDEETTWDA